MITKTLERYDIKLHPYKDSPSRLKLLAASLKAENFTVRVQPSGAVWVEDTNFEGSKRVFTLLGEHGIITPVTIWTQTELSPTTAAKAGK